MKANRGRDNAYELRLRRALHAAGLRYRLHRRSITGTTRSIDIAFLGPRVAVFVDGCFWHGCPLHGTQAKSNSEWWRQKIEANRERDRDTNARLESLGWKVIRIWEHEALVDAVAHIKSEVSHRSTRSWSDTG
jgi:DNA mismatch endonuclease (patch repair protein)